MNYIERSIDECEGAVDKVLAQPRNHFEQLAAESEPGSFFDLMNQLGKALDEHDALTGGQQ